MPLWGNVAWILKQPRNIKKYPHTPSSHLLEHTVYNKYIRMEKGIKSTEGSVGVARFERGKSRWVIFTWFISVPFDSHPIYIMNVDLLVYFRFIFICVGGSNFVLFNTKIRYVRAYLLLCRLVRCVWSVGRRTLYGTSFSVINCDI